MNINDIIIEDYKARMGRDQEESEKINSLVLETIFDNLKNVNATSVSFYNLAGMNHDFNVGRVNSKLVIFNHGTSKKEAPFDVDARYLIINDRKYNIEQRVYFPSGEGKVIFDESGIPLAEWNKDRWQLDILVGLFYEYSEDDLDIFSYIIKKLDNEFINILNENSWVNSTNKGELTRKINQLVQSNRSDDVSNFEDDLKRSERDLRTYKERIKAISDRIVEKRTQLASMDTLYKGREVKLIGDLNAIVANDNIIDVKLVNDKFVISTNRLDIVSDKGYTHVGGKYDIIINMNNVDVAFTSDNKRKSYWTDNDPHPHVNGRSGEPCLGNLSSTVAELCSQGELYALVLTCIDFLQSANTSDPAGKNVRNWDMINEDGEVIDASEYNNENTINCDNCGGEMDTEEDEIYTVYSSYDETNDELGNEMQVCDGCRHDDFYYHEDVHEVIGEVINPVEYAECDDCDCDVNIEDMSTAYRTYDASNNELNDEVFICERCCDNNYSWSDDASEHVGEVINEEPDEEDEE